MRTLWVDMDGTLILVRRRFCEVHRAVCRRLGISPCRDQEYWQAKCEGISSLEILGRQGGEQHWEKYKILRSQLMESQEFLRMDTLRAGAIAALTALRHSYNLLLLSGRTSAEQLRWQLKMLHIRHFFHEVYIVSPYATWGDKAAVLVQHGSPSDIVIGDTSMDILAGTSVGAHTIAITGGLSTEGRLLECKPEYVVHRWTAILSACSVLS